MIFKLTTDFSLSTVYHAIIPTVCYPYKLSQHVSNYFLLITTNISQTKIFRVNNHKIDISLSFRIQVQNICSIVVCKFRLYFKLDIYSRHSIISWGGGDKTSTLFIKLYMETLMHFQLIYINIDDLHFRSSKKSHI